MKNKYLIALLIVVSLISSGCTTTARTAESKYEYTIRAAKDKFTATPSTLGPYSRTQWWKEYERISNDMGSKGWRLIKVEKVSDTKGSLALENGRKIGTTATTYYLFFERSLNQWE